MILTTTPDMGARNVVRPARATSPRTSLRIGDWLLDASLNRLQWGRREARLEPKVADLLVYFARHANQVVSREELEAAVWQGTVVGYDSVTGAVQKLRRALGDDRHRPRYIETLSKRGYRFIAPMRPSPSSQQGADAIVGDEVTDHRARDSRTHRKQLLQGLALVALIGLSAAGLWLSRESSAPSDAFTEHALVGLTLPPLRTRRDAAAASPYDKSIIEALLAGRDQFVDVSALSGDSTLFAPPRFTDTRALAEALAIQYVLVDSIREGLPVSPSGYHFRRGQVYYAIGRYADAITAFRQGLQSNPASERLHIGLAVSLAEIGELGEARWEAEEVLMANPDFSSAEVDAHSPSAPDSWIAPLRSRLLEFSLD